MSSQNPPYPYFSGITYNSSFFSSSSSGLTQSQANALYLKKTVSDIATASETFSGGILASSVDTATPTVNYALLSGLTTGNLGIATNQTDGAVSIGNKASRVGDVNIGNGTGMMGKINLGTGPLSTGIINIGTGTGSTGGIALGATGNTTNIMGPLSSLSTVSLGSVGNTTNIYGALSSLLSVSLGSTVNTTAVNGILTVATGISTATIDTNSLTSNFSFINSLGASNTMGIGVLAPAYGSGPKTIQIGETTITSVHAGGIDCLGTTINGVVAPLIGDLSLASKQTTGTLNIGNYSGRTGIINIGAGMGATGNAINIGTSLAPINIGTLSAGTAGIILGNATNGITTSGLLTASGGIVTSGLDYAGALSLGNTNATSLSIGGSITGGNINIGQGGMTGGIIYIGAGNGALHTGPIYIGASGTPVNTGYTLNVASGLTVGGAITLPTVAYTPNVSGTQLGSIVSGTSPTSVSFSSGISVNVGSISLGIGTWLLTADYAPIVNTSAVLSTFILNFSTVTNTVQYNIGISSLTNITETPPIGTGTRMNMSAPILMLASGTIYLVATLIITSGTLSTGTNLRFQAVRIA